MRTAPPRIAPAISPQPRDQLANALQASEHAFKLKQTANQTFKIMQPSRQELREIVKALQSDECCAWTDCFEGFRSLDSVVYWMHQALNRNEIVVAYADENIGDLLVRGDKVLGRPGRFRWLAPAFATMMTDENDLARPYLELLWVHSNVRRLGIASFMVRLVCCQRRIKRVKAVLKTAVPFWQAIRRSVDDIEVPVSDDKPPESTNAKEPQHAVKRVDLATPVDHGAATKMVQPCAKRRTIPAIAAHPTPMTRAAPVLPPTTTTLALRAPPVLLLRAPREPPLLVEEESGGTRTRARRHSIRLPLRRFKPRAPA